MSKKKLEEGDIFYAHQNGKYFFGKILLDVSKRILLKEPQNLGLKFFSGCCLAQVYSGIYDTPNLENKEVIIPSTFIFTKYFYSKKYKVDWTHYDHEPIDYKELDFPEALQSVHQKGICFVKGELELKTKITSEQFDNEYKIMKGIKGSFNSLIDYACYYQDRKDLMEVESKRYLDWSDFRFSPKKRQEIYRQIGEDMNQSYYEMALKHSHDLGRFYQ
ncbi:sugar transporter [Costertonia aggregata]|uniref:Sugar transporter n=1 Tax=Costertonia aggregata TaxID=343403 RepID=A0A7H9ATS3_9FLAO|nr:sugar transporter [Costertonia aggregata]QLG46840.1 sugar transporter [Costertonia aggregata]